MNHSCKGCGETTHPRGKSMACKDCPASTISCCNCSIKGHFEKVCRQPKHTQQPSPTSNAIHSDQSVSSAAHSDPNTSDQSAVPVESASSATHRDSYPSDRSYVFAFAPAHGSKQAPCKRRHRQLQHQQQREQAQAAGLSPNVPRKARVKEQKCATILEKQQTASSHRENDFI